MSSGRIVEMKRAGREMCKWRMHRSFVFMMIAGLLCSGQLGFAQEFLESPREKTIRTIAEIYCGKEGKPASCVGARASDCVRLMIPFIESCGKSLERTRLLKEKFDRCLWGEYNSVYGLRIEQSERCLGKSSGNPLQELPAEVADRFEFVHPRN